ncbi:MAG: prepilin-type N-terminal cleavage/methylation domain-containing protein [Clostridia bacterium]|nr:prepilin-type N-terminal cleavage/methylation domain-containing protein [Clostridia bacterium]
MEKMVKAFKKLWKNKKGFTIVELMAVFAILAVIAAIAVPQFTGTVKAAKEKTDKASALIIARAAEQKYIDDSATGTKTYAIFTNSSNLADGDLKDYLREVPEAQNNESAAGFVATVENGKCTAVKYCNNSGTALEGAGNLLE